MMPVMSVFYHSTRGQAPELDLRGVTMTGLAADGGLYVPKSWPQFDGDAIAALKTQSYVDVAHKILTPFTASIFSDAVLRKLLDKAYGAFKDPDITPLKQLDQRHWLLELFHGPTLAFKDIALQLLGEVFEYFLAQQSQRMTIVGATSGDTGSAAIAALANRPNIDVFILYPNQGPSDIQRKQMTCVDAPNVHAVAIDGSFDDCQAIVKALFSDPALRTKYNLAAVNSINWLRILAQMVYYFVAASKIALPKAASFVVPTGNFGNVFSAYAAMQCGLPVSKLAVASNRNDILPRFFASGHMQAEAVHATLSPSMDIQISSNFERLLFELCQQNGAQVTSLMNDLKTKGEFAVSPVQLGMARQTFTSASVNDDETQQTIKTVYAQSGYILDPHTAVGVCAARKLNKELPDPVISLACAHPAKFPDAIFRTLGIVPELPDSIATLLRKPERTSLLAAHINDVEKFISERVTL
jgi:threonine synthase